ncbi:TIGR00255 family protein [Sporobacter termitidis DSM 10068]|uniref:TIGR00255 family protein n=1 Tax=Sporobacter termitidis DSM 10068 TaxID=1123282 RepID=A0A1M5TI40_9FIRM|nr:YicC/YloC family endoribonuclease [Sporobacter termitidis]SHH50374.1 TIGR00255 family protein [Sporobacter termitidis DSM 10068]
MIKSMTGYGTAKGASGAVDITAELKSVNNRYLDCNIRLPRVYAAMEDTLKAAVTRVISRGKVDVYINVDTSKADTVTIRLNKPLADAYMEALRTLSDAYGLKDGVSAVDLTRFPDVLQPEKTEADVEQLTADVTAVLEEALRDFDGMRSREGEHLAADIEARLFEIERLTTRAEECSPKSVAEYRAKLEARMAEILQSRDIDEARILMEAAIFADRVAINEETVRLKSHVSQLRAMLQSGEPVGRKLDFLIQELNREANTIGSKGNDAEMARIVVDLKAEIEKIREQAQNIE